MQSKLLEKYWYLIFVAFALAAGAGIAVGHLT